MIKHPRGLYVLGSTELAERWAFYTVFGGAISLFLHKFYGYSEGTSAFIVQLVYALVYLFPLLMAKIGDVWIGHKWATIIGAGLAGVGYLGLTFMTKLTTFISFLLIAIGCALFKPSISTLVDKLYPRGHKLQQQGFLVFYFCVNVGACLSAVSADMTLAKYGWVGPFASAAILMLLGMGIFGLLKNYIVERDSSPIEVEEDNRIPQTTKDKAIWYLGGVAFFFFLAFHQNSTTQVFWVDGSTDRTFGGLFKEPIGVLYYTGFNSAFIILLTPILMWVLNHLETVYKIVISTPKRLVLGMVNIGLGFLILAIGGLMGGDTGKVSSWWFIMSTVMITIGELLLSPMGLSLVTQLAGKNNGGKAIAIWFAGTGFGNLFSGILGYFWNVWKHSSFFFMVSMISVGAAVLLLTKVKMLEACLPKIKTTAKDNFIPPSLESE